MSSDTMAVIDDLYVGADQHIAADGNQTFRRDNIVLSYDDVIANDDPGIWKSQLKKLKSLMVTSSPTSRIAPSVSANFAVGLITKPDP